MKEQTNATPKSKFTSHSVTMADRKKLSATGITSVDGASDNQIELCSCMGRLIVSGSELKIVKFDDADGNLTLTGNIDGIKYAAAKVPLIKRIFK